MNKYGKGKLKITLREFNRERVQQGMKLLRGKRLGSAQSTWGTQPDGLAVPASSTCPLHPPRVPRDVGEGWGRPPAGVPRPPWGAFPPRWCAATGSGSAWKGPGVKVACGSGLELYSTSLPPRLCRLPRACGRVTSSPFPAPRGRDGALLLQRGCRPGGAPPGQGLAHNTKGARGPRRCQPPNRPVLKQEPRSLTHAQVRGPRQNPHGAVKVEAGACRPRWDPHAPACGAPLAHLYHPVGEVKQSARDDTRKMVDYARARQSQRKLWWRHAAVLTCKSVI